jgi:NAD(P)H-hydrate epimerase
MAWWVTPEEMAAFDRRTALEGTPAEELMERAGKAAHSLAVKMAPTSNGPVDIFCGPGNNGGDGFVLARHLQQSGYSVRAVFAADSTSTISPLCMKNLVRFRESGGSVIGMNKLVDLTGTPGLVVDALLGTGFHGGLEGPAAECAGILGAAPAPKLALDTPTGINGNTGQVDPRTPQADATICFAAVKAGLLLPPGCGMAGAIFIADIGIKVDGRPDRHVMDFEAASALLPDRPVDAHKTRFGRVMLLGGSEEMPGAPLLMSMGALRAGAGLVHLYVPYPAAPAVSGRIPEVICSYFLPGDVTSLPDPTPFTCLAAGPGMGTGVDTLKVIRHILANWSLPAVLDADALNVMSGSFTELGSRKAPLVMTPHPGELRKLTGKDDSTLTQRWETAAVLARATGATVLLKGRPAMVVTPDGRRIIIPTGNSGLATGGSGDVLTGMIAGLMGQGMGTSDAACLGAFLHGLAADIVASEWSSRSLIPSDVAGALGRAFALLEAGPPAGLLRLEGRWNGRLWDIP